MNIKESLEYAVKILKNNNIESAILKSKMLLEYILNKNREYCIINQNEVLKSEDEKKYKEGIEKLVLGFPIEYITNKKEFMKLNFSVNENTLIPRQDTEILVEEIINIAVNKKLTVLDMCTGSGAIAISLAKYTNCIVNGIDISIQAIEIAKKNAELNKVVVNFWQSNMFEKIKDKYDIIASNPPYIETEIIEELSKQVKKEPKIALDGGKDGLDFYRILINNADQYLNKNGYLCLEIGYNQRKSVMKIINDTKKYKGIKCIKDLNNNDRVIITKLA